MADKRPFSRTLHLHQQPRRASNFHGTSFDETRLLRPSQEEHRDAVNSLLPGGTYGGASSGKKSPKFSRAQSFGDRLLGASSPKFAKSKKMLPVVAAGVQQQLVAQDGRRGSVASGAVHRSAGDEELEQRQGSSRKLRSRSTSVCVAKWNEQLLAADGR